MQTFLTGHGSAEFQAYCDSLVPCISSAQVREIYSIVILPNSNTFQVLIGGKRVTCRGSNSLTPANSLNSNMNFRLTRDQVVLLETAANL